MTHDVPLLIVMTIDCLHTKLYNKIFRWIYLFLIITIEEGSVTILILLIRELRNREVEYLAQRLELEILLNKKLSSPLAEYFPHY